MIDAVASWTIKNFDPGRRLRKTARRTRIDRAVEAGLIVMMADMLSGGPKAGRQRSGSVRSLERLTGLSKSKIARVLAKERTRQSFKASRSTLALRSKAVLELLEAALPLGGHGFVAASDLSTAIWGNGPVSRTTPATRYGRINEALREIAMAKLGFQIAWVEGLPGIVAISRGHRWSSYSDLHADVEEFKGKRWCLPLSGVVIKSRLGPLWGSREGREVIAAYRIAADTMQWEDLQVLLEACDWTVDPIPTLHILDFLYHTKSFGIGHLPHEMISATRWAHVSKESARVLRLYSALLKDLDALGRDDRFSFVVERVLAVSNWGNRFCEGGDTEAISRFEQLRALASGFHTFDDFFAEMERTIARHLRGRRTQPR